MDRNEMNPNKQKPPCGGSCLPQGRKGRITVSANTQVVSKSNTPFALPVYTRRSFSGFGATTRTFLPQHKLYQRAMTQRRTLVNVKATKDGKRLTVAVDIEHPNTVSDTSDIGRRWRLCNRFPSRTGL